MSWVLAFGPTFNWPPTFGWGPTMRDIGVRSWILRLGVVNFPLSVCWENATTKRQRQERIDAEMAEWDREQERIRAREALRVDAILREEAQRTHQKAEAMETFVKEVRS